MHFFVEHVPRVETEESVGELLKALFVGSVEVSRPEGKQFVGVEEILTVKVLQERVNPALSLVVSVVDNGDSKDL